MIKQKGNHKFHKFYEFERGDEPRGKRDTRKFQDIDFRGYASWNS